MALGSEVHGLFSGGSGGEHTSGVLSAKGRGSPPPQTSTPQSTLRLSFRAPPSSGPTSACWHDSASSRGAPSNVRAQLEHPAGLEGASLLRVVKGVP